jgi:aryl-alcohol dehydrogenase-like predicted oxidoreductase
MNYRRFGNTDLLISEIGFGAWGIGGAAMVGSTAIGWGKADDSISKAAIFKSLDVGINFFDTADIYGLGHSEELIGNTIGNNKEIIVASKVGNVVRNRKFLTDYSKKYILKACEASLKRLKRDSIDYYQLHSAKIQDLERGVCIDAMELLRESGKIRYWGLSLNSFNPFPEASFVLHSGLSNGIQLVLNVVNQLALPLIGEASKCGFGIIARMPLQFGLLTGKFDNYSNFPISDHRNKRLTPEIIKAYKKNIVPLWTLCEKYKITKAQLALSYILAHPEITTAITGMRTTHQVEENVSGIRDLNDEDVSLIENHDFTEVLDLMKRQH